MTDTNDHHAQEKQRMDINKVKKPGKWDDIPIGCVVDVLVQCSWKLGSVIKKTRKFITVALREEDLSQESSHLEDYKLHMRFKDVNKVRVVLNNETGQPDIDLDAPIDKKTKDRKHDNTYNNQRNSRQSGNNWNNINQSSNESGNSNCNYDLYSEEAMEYAMATMDLTDILNRHNIEKNNYNKQNNSEHNDNKMNDGNYTFDAHGRNSSNINSMSQEYLNGNNNIRNKNNSECDYEKSARKRTTQTMSKDKKKKKEKKENEVNPNLNTNCENGKNRKKRKNLKKNRK